MNAAMSACGIRNEMRPVSAVKYFLATCGRRARISRSIPFARTDDPSVADGGSDHSATNEADLLIPCAGGLIVVIEADRNGSPIISA